MARGLVTDCRGTYIVRFLRNWQNSESAGCDNRKLGNTDQLLEFKAQGDDLCADSRQLVLGLRQANVTPAILLAALLSWEDLKTSNIFG